MYESSHHSGPAASFDYPENVTKLLADLRVNRNLSLNANANLIWNNFGFAVRPKPWKPGFYSVVNANLVWDLSPRLETHPERIQPA